MPLRRKQLRSRNTSPKQSGEARHVRKLDAWLERAAHLSQPLLLALACFGYFYTVRPVYQKELLSEQIAGKEIELLRLQKRIDATAPAIQQLEAERMNLAAQISTLSEQSRRAAATRQELLEAQLALTRQNTDLTATVARRTVEAASAAGAVRGATRRTYHGSFTESVLLEYFWDDDPYKIVADPTYESVAKFVMTPYVAISSALSRGDSEFLPPDVSVQRDIKDEYHRQVRETLEAQRSALARPLDDVNAIVLLIQQQMAAAALDPTPNDNFNEVKYETTKRLTRTLYESRTREMERTRKFMESLTSRLS